MGSSHDALRFSTTQTWGDEYTASDRTRAATIEANDPSLLELIYTRLGDPPANTSNQTRAELAALHALQCMRTADDRREIYHELTHHGVVSRFGSDDATRAIAHRVREFIAPYAFLAKRHFDRVRPSVLHSRLQPCIEVPGHPAYPSGHATEAVSLALVLAHIDSAKAAHYHSVAMRIATNREIAGVHYHSDTLAGVSLAEVLHPHVLASLYG